jgi:polysaccharide biosynthesis protein PslG
MTNLFRSRWIVLTLHVIVIAGLVISLVITAVHQRYMTRGVSFSTPEHVIPHTDVNPLGVNTFLHEEADRERVDQTLDMIADAGFSWIRQIFVWSDIERAPGVYWDEHEAVDTWEKYDYIMQGAAERGLDVLVRLDKPPAWAQQERGNVDEFPDGPPDDIQDYVNFVTSVVERYQGQIGYVQIWNEPNLGVEWGGLEIDPEGFTELLAASYQAVKSVDPDIAVVMPGLAPNDQTGPDNLSDLLFLEGMYEAGAADYFDIAAVMIYGYGFSPRDRRVSFERNNFSRAIQTREIMEEYGDHEKPVWAVEYGWVSLPEDWDGEESPWGQPVTRQEQAEYLFGGYLRAQQEWPWMGPMMIWAFRFPIDPDHPDQIDNPTRGFRIVDHDFTPRPAFDLLSERSVWLDRAFPGRYGIETRYIVHDQSWTRTTRNGTRVLQPESSTASLQIPFSGTGVELQFDGSEGMFTAEVAGQTREITPDATSGGTFRIAGLSDGPHVLTLAVAASGSDQLALTGFSVERRTVISWIYPWLYGLIAIVLMMNLGSLAWSVRSTREPNSSRPL